MKKLIILLLALSFLLPFSHAEGSCQIVKTIELTTNNTAQTIMGTGWSLPASWRRIYWEPTAYGGTVKVYFEAFLASNNASYTAYIGLYANGGAEVTGSEFTTTSTTTTPYVRYRSGDISGNLSASTEYDFQLKSSNASGQSKCIEARLIIVISGTMTACQTDIDLQPSVGGIATSYTDQYSAQFLYTAANWNGTVAVWYEACMYAGNASYTMYADLYDVTATAEVSGSQITTQSTTAVRVRSSGAITLINGHIYECRQKASTSSGGYVCSGTIIIKQTASPTLTETHYVLDAANFPITGSSYGTPTAGQVLWEAGLWGTTPLTVYYEGSVYDSVASETAYTNCYGASQLAEISYSQTPTYSAYRVRSASISPSDATAYYFQCKSASSGHGGVSGPRFVILATYTAPPAGWGLKINNITPTAINGISVSGIQKVNGQ